MPLRRIHDTHRDRPAGPVPAPRWGVTKLLFGILFVVAVLLLGAVTKIQAVSDFELWFDRRIAEHERSAELTSVARTLSEIVTPEYVGIGALVLIPLVLLLVRHRFDALRALCVMGGALALAFVVKRLIDENRPPAKLWAMPADHTPAYPSGHTTVAAAIVVTLIVVIGSFWWRSLIAFVGILFVLAVAGSRVYLANHYPLDVIGSMLVALAAGFVVAGLAALPPIHRTLSRMDRRR
jgi:undecaprenyl-diphosphatase